MAGPNGSGKTTVTTRLREDHWSEEVAELRFGGWNSPSAVKHAADGCEARREEFLADRKGIAFELVFSTPSKVDFVRIFFIGTASPTINAARVAARGMAGGHTVAIDKIISRYTLSLANLPAAMELADRVDVYDNTPDNEEARLCARITDGTLRKVYGELPEARPRIPEPCAIELGDALGRDHGHDGRRDGGREWVADAIALEHAPDFVDARAP